MTTRWFDLPTEIRFLVYQHFYSSATICLYALSKGEIRAYDWLGGSTESLSRNKLPNALKCTSQRLWFEAEPFYYACTSFELESFSGHNIKEPRFDIEKRERNLSISFDNGLDDVLESVIRRFEHEDTTMNTSLIREDPFPWSIRECREDNSTFH